MSGKTVAIFGGGPAGLMAADQLSASGFAVDVYEAMPTVARKFLLAGKSGLNLTHAEDYTLFRQRYGAASGNLAESLNAFTPEAVRQWADRLGAETFVGSSGRIFPRAMKGSPLLRAWLRQLAAQGVTIQTRHRWIGSRGRHHQVETVDGPRTVEADAALLAFGGASWPRLGSDGAWVPALRERGVEIEPFRPANCGFDILWPEHLIERFAGEPVKSVTATTAAGRIPGEFVVSHSGIEGSLVYAHAAALRDALGKHGNAVLELDLAPGRTQERLAADLARQKEKLSFSGRLRKGAGLDAVKTALLRFAVPEAPQLSAAALAAAIKALPLPVERPRPIEEAISSAGGIRLDAIDRNFMLKSAPGLFVAGEMLDWEAPTGGYLLTACFATGRAAALGIADYLGNRLEAGGQGNSI